MVSTDEKVRISERDKFIEVGEFNQKINDLVGSNMPLQKIYRSKGLITHLLKRKHFNCIKHIDDIPDIIKRPDYVGINPNESDNTIELIKVLDEYILVGIKLNINEKYLYVSTMYDIQEAKILRRLHSGRLVKFVDE